MKKWTESEIEKLRNEYKTRGIKDIAQDIGRSRNSAYLKAHQLGLVKMPRKGKELEQIAAG